MPHYVRLRSTRDQFTFHFASMNFNFYLISRHLSKIS